MLRPHLRLYTIVLAIGGFTAIALPLAVRAQSGDAIAHAEHTCLGVGLGPNSVAYDSCVARTAAAYDRGRPNLAVREASRVAEARQVCQSYEIEPMTLGYRKCVADESNGQGYEVGPEIAQSPEAR
jgi:hypothetical protein